jgi:hypothetical protein
MLLATIAMSVADAPTGLFWNYGIDRTRVVGMRRLAGSPHQVYVRIWRNSDLP